MEMSIICFDNSLNNNRRVEDYFTGRIAKNLMRERENLKGERKGETINSLLGKGGIVLKREKKNCQILNGRREI